VGVENPFLSVGKKCEFVLFPFSPRCVRVGQFAILSFWPLGPEGPGAGGEGLLSPLEVTPTLGETLWSEGGNARDKEAGTSSLSQWPPLWSMSWGAGVFVPLNWTAQVSSERRRLRTASCSARSGSALGDEFSRQG
jgi:hypothetical protein